jgi:hypothetical protein
MNLIPSCIQVDSLQTSEVSKTSEVKIDVILIAKANKLLDKYDMVIVSNGTRIGCVIWDPENGRKLIQDLRCTSKLDEPTWRQKVFGKDLTLPWTVCDSVQ